MLSRARMSSLLLKMLTSFSTGYMMVNCQLVLALHYCDVRQVTCAMRWAGQQDDAWWGDHVDNSRELPGWPYGTALTASWWYPMPAQP